MLSEQARSLYVVAVVAGQRIAVDASNVAAVVDLPMIVPVPLSPPHILGLCALRSQIVTVIDVATALGQPLHRASQRAITMEIDRHHYAFVVSSVDQVEPNLGKMRPVDASIGREWASAASARVQTESGMALLLDPRSLLGICPETTQ
jgi:purine-binding chemotaxis protein CheW